jgi:rRNA maturation endonuclease Nob1
MPDMSPNVELEAITEEIRKLNARRTVLYAGIGEKLFSKAKAVQMFRSTVLEIGDIEVKLAAEQKALNAAKKASGQAVCTVCGTWIAQRAKFCSNCGAKVDEDCPL